MQVVIGIGLLFLFLLAVAKLGVRIIAGCTLMLLGLFFLLVWEADTHNRISFDSMEDILFLLVPFTPIILGILLLLYPRLKSKKKNE
jgi:membrane-bound ClpP family serine protease